MCRGFYHGLVCLGAVFQSLLLLAIRLFWGFGFFQAGYGKLADVSKVSQFFSGLGIPFPDANAYIAGGIECVGGALLMVGLFSRIVSIPLFIVMLVAYSTAHASVFFNAYADPAGFVGAAPFNFMFAALIIFAFGPGKISLDYLLCKLFFQKKCSKDDRDNSTSC